MINRCRPRLAGMVSAGYQQKQLNDFLVLFLPVMRSCCNPVSCYTLISNSGSVETMLPSRIAGCAVRLGAFTTKGKDIPNAKS